MDLKRVASAEKNDRTTAILSECFENVVKWNILRASVFLGKRQLPPTPVKRRIEDWVLLLVSLLGPFFEVEPEFTPCRYVAMDEGQLGVACVVKEPQDGLNRLPCTQIASPLTYFETENASYILPPPRTVRTVG